MKRVGWLALSMLALGCESPPLDALDGAVALAAFGAPCAVSEDCESGICLALEDGRAVCSRVCGARTDCPAGRNWECVQPDIDARVCGCVPNASAEICGDGLDNDCNGAADDCRFCEGEVVASN